MINYYLIFIEVSKRNEFLTQRIMFLSLRTTLAAFSDRFHGCWPQIAHSIREIALKTLGEYLY